MWLWIENAKWGENVIRDTRGRKLAVKGGGEGGGVEKLQKF